MAFQSFEKFDIEGVPEELLETARTIIQLNLAIEGIVAARTLVNPANGLVEEVVSGSPKEIARKAEEHSASMANGLLRRTDVLEVEVPTVRIMRGLLQEYRDRFDVPQNPQSTKRTRHRHHK